jgi:DNA processing protein
LGAYEALWCQEGATFKTLAAKFRAQPGSIPSDFVAPAEAERYAQMALGTIREAGIRHFGVRVQGAGEYPAKLLDAEHPVTLLYFQGNWDITSTRCIAIVGTRRPSEEGDASRR